MIFSFQLLAFSNQPNQGVRLEPFGPGPTQRLKAEG
jgi:hypothetical protein